MTAVPVGPPVTTTNDNGQKVTTTHLSDGTIQVDTQTGGDEGAHRPTTTTEIKIDPAWAAAFRKPEDQDKPLPAPYQPKQPLSPTIQMMTGLDANGNPSTDTGSPPTSMNPYDPTGALGIQVDSNGHPIVPDKQQPTRPFTIYDITGIGPDGKPMPDDPLYHANGNPYDPSGLLATDSRLGGLTDRLLPPDPHDAAEITSIRAVDSQFPELTPELLEARRHHAQPGSSWVSTHGAIVTVTDDGGLSIKMPNGLLYREVTDVVGQTGATTTRGIVEVPGQDAVVASRTEHVPTADGRSHDVVYGPDNTITGILQTRDGTNRVYLPEKNSEGKTIDGQYVDIVGDRQLRINLIDPVTGKPTFIESETRPDKDPAHGAFSPEHSRTTTDTFYPDGHHTSVTEIDDAHQPTIQTVVYDKDGHAHTVITDKNTGRVIADFPTAPQEGLQADVMGLIPDIKHDAEVLGGVLGGGSAYGLGDAALAGLDIASLIPDVGPLAQAAVKGASTVGRKALLSALARGATEEEARTEAQQAITNYLRDEHGIGAGTDTGHGLDGAADTGHGLDAAADAAHEPHGGNGAHTDNGAEPESGAPHDEPQNHNGRNNEPATDTHTEHEPYTGPSEEAPPGVYPANIKEVQVGPNVQWQDINTNKFVKMPEWAKNPPTKYAKASHTPEQEFSLTSQAKNDITKVQIEKDAKDIEIGDLRAKRDDIATSLGIDKTKLTQKYLAGQEDDLLQQGVSIADIERLKSAMSAANKAENQANKLTEKMGMIAARDYIRQMGGEVITGLDDSLAGSGTLDVVGIVNGKLVVIEAKGGGAQLGERWVNGEAGQLIRVQQGTRQYLQWMLHNDPELAKALAERGLLDAARNGDMDVIYDMVRYNPKVGRPQWARFNSEEDAAVPPEAIRQIRQPGQSDPAATTPDPPQGSDIAARMPLLAALTPWNNLPTDNSSDPSPSLPSLMESAMQTMLSSLRTQTALALPFMGIPTPLTPGGNDNSKRTDQSLTLNITTPTRQAGQFGDTERHKCLAYAASIRL